MGKRRKLWSIPRITDPRYPGHTMRITELRRGGNLYAVRMVGGKQKMTSLKRTRADLGATDTEQDAAARTLGLNLIAALATGRSPENARVAPIAEAEVLTLERLVDLYELRGSLTARAKYREEQVAKLRRIAAHLGPGKPVVSLGRSDVDRWITHRREQGVREGTIAGDIAALKIALNWAVEERRTDGRSLLSANPLTGVKIEKEKHQRRPVADADRYRALKDVAHKLPPLFGLALDLAFGAGHRIGAILALQWQHVLFDPAAAVEKATELDSDFGWAQDDFPHGGIRWYAERRANNKAHEHVAPMTALVREALERARSERPAIAGAWLFPSPRDTTQPLDRYVLNRWLRKAEKLAALPHLKGGSWHPFRRGWATQRKHFPLADVAKLGGWRDEATLQKCYTRADRRTVRAIVNDG